METFIVMMQGVLFNGHGCCSRYDDRWVHDIHMAKQVNKQLHDKRLISEFVFRFLNKPIFHSILLP